MPLARFLLMFCLAGAAASAQVADAAQLVEQLADTPTRSAARERLLALGASAAVPLAARIGTASADHACACLEVLRELGPAGGAAVPALVNQMRGQRGGGKIQVAVQVALLETLAELIPYRGDDIEITARDNVGFGLLMREPDQSEVFALWGRLIERQRFPRGLDVDAMLAAAAGRRQLATEVAIEQLGARGPAAVRAVPLLRAVLDQPEPRVLPTGKRVPLHRKAAKALLAIAPGGPEAETARAVLAGTWSPPARIEPAVPERARRRIDGLLAELGAPDQARRQAAADNLVALGGIAVGPVATLLDPSVGGDRIDGALEVLRRVGKHATPAVPAIVEALTRLPANHTIAVIRTLTATVPWSTDVYLGPSYSASVGHLRIHGQRIVGTIDVSFLNAFSAASMEMHSALEIPVDGPPERLREFLDDPSVARRRRALEVIAARGTECAALLDTLASMLRAPQPPEGVAERIDAQSSRFTQVDRSDAIQRLAATAIVAIAPADHPLVATARERLAQPESK